MKRWGERKSHTEQYHATKARLNRELSRPPVGRTRRGHSVGLTFVLEDRAGKDVRFLAKNLGNFLTVARKRPKIGVISATFIPSVPLKFVNVDPDRVLKQGMLLSDTCQTIQAYMGGLFVNNFIQFGRTWQCMSRPKRRTGPHRSIGVLPVPSQSGCKGTDCLNSYCESTDVPRFALFVPLIKCDGIDDLQYIATRIAPDSDVPSG
jgi:multidrug efflux pump subunit AcrB